VLSRGKLISHHKIGNLCCGKNCGDTFLIIATLRSLSHMAFREFSTLWASLSYLEIKDLPTRPFPAEIVICTFHASKHAVFAKQDRRLDAMPGMAAAGGLEIATRHGYQAYAFKCIAIFDLPGDWTGPLAGSREPRSESSEPSSGGNGPPRGKTARRNPTPRRFRLQQRLRSTIIAHEARWTSIAFFTPLPTRAARQSRAALIFLLGTRGTDGQCIRYNRICI
jgi:hypothetical protein